MPIQLIINPATAGPMKVAEPKTTEETAMATEMSSLGTRLGPMVTRAGMPKVPTMPWAKA